MDVRIVGIPVIDCDPVEFVPRSRSASAINSRVNARRSCMSVASSGRNDEAEVVTIVLTSLGKRALVGHIGLRIEQTGVGASAETPSRLKVSDMLGRASPSGIDAPRCLTTRALITTRRDGRTE